MRKWVASIPPGAVFAGIGFTLICLGTWMIYHPLGYIVAGAGILLEGIWQAVEERRSDERLPEPPDHGPA